MFIQRSSITEPVVMAKFLDLVLEDRQMTVNFVVWGMNVSRGLVYNILYIVHVRKLSFSVVDTFPQKQHMECEQYIVELYLRKYYLLLFVISNAPESALQPKLIYIGLQRIPCNQSTSHNVLFSRYNDSHSYI